MDGPRIAAMAAVALGGFAMMVNFLVLPMLMNKVSKLHVDMQVGMQSFKALADQAWDEMMDIRRVYVPRSVRDVEYDTGASGGGAAVLFPYGYVPQAPGNSPAEYQQQAWDQMGYSSASSGAGAITASFSDDGATTTTAYVAAFDNGCPAGPPGLPGDNAKDGLDGPPGLDGLQGQSAQEMKFEDLDMCSICPGGPKGPAGPAGPSGKPGKKGVIGEPGKHGANATTGAVGPAGPKGFQGLPGKPGFKGKTGKSAPGGKGKPGPKGATGPIGRAGPQGPPGNSSTSNNGSGPTGPRGLTGINGIPGKTGQPGPPGAIGIAGGEGGYCPCPKELQKLGLGNSTGAPGVQTATGGAPPVAPAPLASVAEGANAASQPPADLPQTNVNFGGSAPGYGPPGSAPVANNGGGLVALPPAGGVDGALPPGQQQQGSPGASGDLLASQGAPPGDHVAGGLNNLMQLPTMKK